MLNGRIESHQSGSLVEKSKLIIYCDGGFSKKRNPRFPAYGSFLPVKMLNIDGRENIVSFDGQKFYYFKNNIKTHNMAEMAILYNAIFYANYYLKDKKVTIRCDSEFALNIAQGKFSSNKEKIKTITEQLRKLVLSVDFELNLEYINGKKMKEILGH